MKPKDKTEQKDRDLFRQAVGDVRPLQHDKIKPYEKRPKAIPRQTELSEQRVIIDMMSDDYEAAEIQTGEELYFAREGIQSRVMRKLKRGQYRLEAELDLHGLNVEAARRAISEFLELCQRDELRCVRIIHGKGLSSRHKGPVLKHMVNRWLRQRKEVLAFTSTLPQHGGTGAIYVLLKRAYK
jgi:DNA-nicking Smr family endonuclease